MSEQLLVTFNAGSSTVKIGLFTRSEGALTRIGKGMIDFRKTPLRFELSEGPDRFDIELEAEAAEELDDVLSEAFGRLSWHYDMSGVMAIGHRIVHGGDLFDGAVLIDDRLMAQMEALVPLAPLHQPQALRLIRAITRLRPELRQTASFDTAFHRTMSEVARRFALPRALHEEGIKRYGFHGLSYRSIAGELARNWPEHAAGKVVVAHLGSGASLCAMRNGASRDTSMGFSTLDGVPMATRCGALDAGVVLHLARSGRDLSDIEDLLYHRSGLLGVSGISADSRALLESEEPEAKEAIELFCFRVAGEVSRLTSTLGGLDALVFTAGIGEHQPAIRADICTRLMWLGIDLDPAANAENRTVISSPASRLAVLVIPTDEEQVIAAEASSVLGG
ncbi:MULTISPECIES: acetate/propionate family kinase [Brucella/Ochrobactrum group]|uniref:acetate/propionate family kinase n=1 Tax=Brucella/Ochrobactrum group TaxID=2826938 RepID=UPI00124EF5D0|nr:MULTISPECIES: acetate/propionate family kinase [Brucella/Ochrobactrum group]KAB2758326.1 acetate/propionate family kinase [Brucella anthropi]MCQ9147160.1 acetate/propionate family kinase [Ochrobactrum sp. BTU2]